MKDAITDKDRLFEQELATPGDFVFDQRVVRVFPDMINRSVPGYGLVVPMMGMLARRYAVPGTSLYDLGCSLGAVSLAMQAAVRAAGVKIISVDNSEEMIKRFRADLSHVDAKDRPPIEPVLGDILQTPINNASVVAMNFTLQFVPTGERRRLLGRIRDGLCDGGVLLLSEKIRFEDDQEQALQNEWHHDFKRAQGYSDLEIANKRDALEDVMVPESLAGHYRRLELAGFRQVYRWYQGFNFVSLVAFA